MTSYERTGWRDEAISRRHRDWGEHLPAVDADFLLLEYDHSTIVGVVDYKHHQRYGLWAPDVDLVSIDEWSVRALRHAADRLGVPFWLAVYWPATWSFLVVPVNGVARRHFAAPTLLTERAYVAWLYRLRQRSPHPELLAKLHDHHPATWRHSAAACAFLADDFDDFDEPDTQRRDV